jgi:hypothetical protein
MLTINATNLHWLSIEVPEHDLCAHGGLVIRRGKEVLVNDAEEVWTLSAAALFLLRTLDQDHTSESRVAEHLFPCCGHFMIAEENTEDVVIIGCPHGRDWSVIHQGDRVVLNFDDESTVILPWSEWRDAVAEFSRPIEIFYEKSAPKIPGEDDVPGFTAFRAEWKRRIRAADLSP